MAGHIDTPRNPPWTSVFLVSFSLLSFELSLLRTLALIYWHHQAQLILAGALLGFGAGGTLLATARRYWLAHQRGALTLLPVVYLAALITSHRMSLAIPFNPLELAWHPEELANLLLLHLALALPFLAGSLYLGLALTSFPGREHRIYGTNLLGSGLGAAAVLLLSAWLHPERLVAFAAISGAAAIWMIPTGGAVSGRRSLRPILIRLTAVALAALALWPRAGLDLTPSPYKSESQALLVPRTEIVAERWGPLGLWRALEGPSVHYAPGMSLGAQDPLPRQTALFLDGEPAGAVTRFSDPPPSFLSHLPTALPFRLRPIERALVVGLGGGLGVMQALAGGARRVEVAEVDDEATSLLAADLASSGGDLLSHPAVTVRRADGRLILQESDARGFDIIELAYLEGLGPAGAGVFATRENYLLTAEALALCLSRLSPRGVLSLAHWMRLPPRDGLRAVSTLTQALQELGYERPARHLVMIRSWNTTLLLASPAPFSAQELVEVKEFCREELFDLVYFPGITPEETNRVNRLPEPLFHQGAVSLLGAERDRFIAGYPFDISPSTDDRPFFSHSFRWRAFPELWRNMGRDLIPYLEGGYLLLVGGLLEGILVGAVLLLIPLVRARPEERAAGRASAPYRPSRGGVLLYFSLIGLGFMILELAVMGKIALAVGHSTAAAGVTITGFLLFSGLGCVVGNRWERAGRDLLRGAGVWLLAASLLFPGTIAPVARLVAGLGLSARAGAALLVLFPLAFPLGFFFPAGLARLARTRAALVPWAWGVNGFASVAGSLLGALLPVSLGFRLSMAAAGICYLLAGLVRQSPTTTPASE